MKKTIKAGMTIEQERNITKPKGSKPGWQFAYKGYVGSLVKKMMPSNDGIDKLIGIEKTTTTKIRSKKLKKLIQEIKHEAIVAKQYEFAGDLRMLEKKYFNPLWNSLKK